MKKFAHIMMTVALLLLVGCRGQRESAYIKDAPRGEAVEITNIYTTVIQPDDLLYIYVYSETPESAYAFNEETNKGLQSAPARGYRVMPNGNLHFPILGNIEAAGMTLGELAEALERRLKNEDYVSDAIVTVTPLNFHVTVIGEVKHPRVLHSPNGRLTIFEALAQCGDITEYGLRTNVVVVRQNQDSQVVDTLDLTKMSVLSSPFYYLQQNDVVYVEPTEKRRRDAYRREDWVQYMSMGVSALDIAYKTIYSIVLFNSFYE